MTNTGIFVVQSADPTMECVHFDSVTSIAGKQMMHVTKHKVSLLNYFSLRKLPVIGSNTVVFYGFPPPVITGYSRLCCDMAEKEAKNQNSKFHSRTS